MLISGSIMACEPLWCLFYKLYIMPSWRGNHSDNVGQ